MRKGERYRKAVRGCIVSRHIAVLHLVIVKKAEGKKGSSKAPKIQRLVTPAMLQRKRSRMAIKKQRQTKAKTQAADYQKLLALRQKEMREKKQEKVSQRRSQRSSRASEEQ